METVQTRPVARDPVTVPPGGVLGRGSPTDVATEAAAPGIQLSVVVPTYNERDNVGAVVASLERVLAGIGWEVIFVDDASPDNTADVVRGLARTDRRVRLISRHNRRGLSSAVVEGALAAAADVIAVMDGDMQHDEAVLPELYRRVASGEADVVAASRFLGDGVEEGLGTERRVKISNTGIALANRLFGLDLTDPLTGFFAMRRETLKRALPDLSALGFKILLDVITSAEPRPRVEEVPFRFRARAQGESKLDRRVMYDFLLFFLEKTIGRVIHVPARFLSFALINSLGILVHLMLLVPAHDLFHASFVTSQLIATVGSMFFNFTVNNLITYNDATLKGLRFWRGFVIFSLVCSVGVFANVGVASMIHDVYADLLYLVPAIAGALITVVWNFVATKMLVWGRAP
ncbi:glycosyltransferase [Chthonobacter rhizosphaerae]|uniref:glycosyltransferase n=1 Tax=Chthonobacter rhizosphaerae TaxID=2735553 RepID=UPI0015EE79FE|nr:glycosyltransferase family 2 protein [Chthonobacter rhizosphaerae]